MLFLCGACQIASYCEEKCQSSAWGQHKPICNVIQTLSNQKTVDNLLQSRLTDAENGNAFST